MSKLDSVDITNLINKNNINTKSYFFGDFYYYLPNKHWVFNEFAKSLDSLLNFLNNNTPNSASNDCDDFARAGAFLAQTLHSRTSPDSNAGLAIGEFWYKKDSGVAHAINIIVVRDYENLQLLFLEPQTGKEIILTENEKNSCFFWRF